MTPRVLALVLACLLAPAAAFPEFRFKIPEGFRDLSPGVPEGNFAGLPEEVVSEAKSGMYAAFAMDLREEDSNFNAVVKAGILRVNDDFLREQVKKRRIQLESASRAPVTVLESGIVHIDGVAVLRTVLEVEYPYNPMRELQFFVPGGRQFAVLSYSAPSETFARYLPFFDAAAMATEGADTNRVDFWRAARFGLIVGAIGFVVALIHQVVQQRRGGGARPPMRRTPPRPLGRR